MRQQAEQDLQWLYSLEGRGIVYKLERMERALKLIDDPHLKLNVVHIAGTKGKGSVAAMLDSCLRAAGYRCGLYTKPHLVSLSERFRIDGAQMPTATMVEYVERLRKLYEARDVHLTFFEFTVAMMFLYFAEQKVDVAIVETGMGGRLDSTNVVRPLLSVITPVGFDHVEYLGTTIESIAREKGGIIKPRTPVVIGARRRAARAVLTAIARQNCSPVVMLNRDFSFRSRTLERCFDYHGPEMRLLKVRLGLPGPFQYENAALVIAALERMRASGWKVTEETVRTGLETVKWPGRFDIVSRRPLIVLDCAHNEMSVRALLEALGAEFGSRIRPRLIFGCQADKDWDRMAQLLRARIKDVTLAQAAPKQPLAPETLYQSFASAVPTRIVRDPAHAFDQVIAESADDDVIVVTGSIYLVGEVYSHFLARHGRRGLFPEYMA
jgi:dihydrofolate synthase/folylpolyglutamate synthase